MERVSNCWKEVIIKIVSMWTKVQNIPLTDWRSDSYDVFVIQSWIHGGLFYKLYFSISSRLGVSLKWSSTESMFYQELLD